MGWVGGVVGGGRSPQMRIYKGNRTHHVVVHNYRFHRYYPVIKAGEGGELWYSYTVRHLVIGIYVSCLLATGTKKNST